MYQSEYVSKGEVLFDYVLNKYSPLKRQNILKSIIPLKDKSKLRICNIFYETLKKSNIDNKFYEFLLQIRKEIGINQTVWGVKNISEKITWELYFYRHHQPDKIKLKNLINILKSYFEIEQLIIDEELPYIMFSFDIDEKMKIINTHVYFVKFFGSSFQAWSYLILPSKREFENHYEFFTSCDYKSLSEKVLLSPFVNSKIDISQVLVPELMDCKSICITSKRNENGIYFSGINIEQFLFFLKRYRYPNELIKYIEINKSQLTYILFDVGFNYSFKNISVR